MKVRFDRSQAAHFLDDVCDTWVAEALVELPIMMAAEAPVGPDRRDRQDRGGKLKASHESAVRGTRRKPKVLVTANTSGAMERSYSVLAHEGRGEVYPNKYSDDDNHKLRWFVHNTPHTAESVGPFEGNPWMFRTFVLAGFKHPRHVRAGRTIV